MSKAGALARLLTAATITTMFLVHGEAARAQDTDVPIIAAPTDGQIVQGLVPVQGTTQITDFATSELAFAYAADPTQTWFTIHTSSTPVAADTISVWDTTSITDGDYLLRLRVNRVDGSTRDALIKVLVRNYTSAPTATSAATATSAPVLVVPTAIIIPTAADTATATSLPPIPTATPLPPNPAAITPAAVFSGFWRGALVVGLLVLVFGALVRRRR